MSRHRIPYCGVALDAIRGKSGGELMCVSCGGGKEAVNMVHLRVREYSQVHSMVFGLQELIYDKLLAVW